MERIFEGLAGLKRYLYATYFAVPKGTLNSMAFAIVLVKPIVQRFLLESCVHMGCQLLCGQGSVKLG